MVPFKSLGAVSYSPSIVTMAVSVAVCEIFRVKEWCDLENRVRVRSGSREMAPFDRSHMSSYLHSIVTMAISCTFARYSELSVENRQLFIPHLYLAPRQGWPRRNFVKMFDANKTRMIGRMVNVTFCDSTLNTNLCPAISVVGLFYLLTVIMNFVCRFILGVDFTRRFRFCMCA